MSFGSHHRNFSIESRDDMYLNSYEEGLEKRCNLFHIIGTFLLNIRYCLFSFEIMGVWESIHMNQVALKL